MLPDLDLCPWPPTPLASRLIGPKLVAKLDCVRLPGTPDLKPDHGPTLHPPLVPDARPLSVCHPVSLSSLLVELSEGESVPHPCALVRGLLCHFIDTTASATSLFGQTAYSSAPSRLLPTHPHVPTHRPFSAITLSITHHPNPPLLSDRSRQFLCSSSTK